MFSSLQVSNSIPITVDDINMFMNDAVFVLHTSHLYDKPNLSHPNPLPPPPLATPDFSVRDVSVFARDMLGAGVSVNSVEVKIDTADQFYEKSLWAARDKLDSEERGVGGSLYSQGALKPCSLLSPIVCGDVAEKNSREDRLLVTDTGFELEKERPIEYQFKESLFGAPVYDSDDTSMFSIDSANDCTAEKTLSFMHWNIEGLSLKLNDPDFWSFVTSFHFVSLVETFIIDLNINAISGYTVFSQPAVKLSDRGRPSGGVLCLIKNELMSFVRKVDVNIPNLLLFILDKKLFNVHKDILYVCAYVPPEGSNFYSYIDEDTVGIELLENCLIDHALANQDLFVIIASDLNARISNSSQTLFTHFDFDKMHSSHSASAGRYSQDKGTNSFGLCLLNMCTALNLRILNGVCHGDQNGNYTYISDTGSSVIDYFLISEELFEEWFDSCCLQVVNRLETKHFPLTFSVSLPLNNMTFTASSQSGFQLIEKLIWDSTKLDDFMKQLNSDECKRKLNLATELVDVNINLALSTFNDCLHEVCTIMKKNVNLNRSKKCQDWFDNECRIQRRLVRRALRKYRRTLHADDRHVFCKLRREYKHLLDRKKKLYNTQKINELIESIDSQQKFWNCVHNVLPKRKQTRNDISMEDWFEHFCKLLDTGSTEDEENVYSQLDDIDDDSDNLHFNRPITEDEVTLAIRKLKSNKSAGPDGLISEVFKYASAYVTPFFMSFLNKLFDSGVFPDNWTESVIVALHKKGNVNNPNNYRGISISDISSKVYGAIINRRIQEWVEENDIVGEHQAGFRRGYSTIDHIFTLMSCIQKQFSMNRKLYVAFIDFQKAFDSINRQILWAILVKAGVKGKLYNCLKSMYLNVRARIRSGNKLTDYIRCTVGVKQGDVCSPILFSLFINELAIEIIKKGRHGLLFENIELFILLLADDIVLLSETIVGLQTQLNNLQHSSLSLGLNVNMEKSNIIVFRKGGYLGARERWFFNGIQMPVVNVYKYLGIYFSTKLSFTAACTDLVSRAKGAFLTINQRLSILGNHSIMLVLKLFDKQVMPILQYGSEIWGLEKSALQCEKLHLFVLKKILGVNQRTPNDLVYGELNRFPLTIIFTINVVRYWLKLLEFDDNRIPKKAYKLIFKIDESGKRNWVSNVKQCLFSFGFGYVWLNQGVGDKKSFLKLFRQRLVDCRWQNWIEHIQTSSRFNTYLLCYDKMHL